jgi:hypothetical protein
MTDQNDAEKPTEQWVSGNEPMTGPQRSYLETLLRGTGEDVPETMTKAEASELIDRLKAGGNDAPVGSAERIREDGIVDQQGVVADAIGRSDDE